MSKPGASVEASQRATPACLGGPLQGLSLPRQVLFLAFWPLMEQVLGFFVGLADLLIAGRMTTGVERIAILDAMGLGGYVAWFFNILQGAVATGVMALVSRATGSRDDPLANSALGQGLWLGIAAGSASCLALKLGIDPLISWGGLTPAAAIYAHDFLHMLAWSAPCSGVLFAVNAALRGSGDTRTPFLSMIVVNVFNIAFSWGFVFGPAPIGGHGVEGIAMGTVIGWIAGMATTLLLVGRRHDAILRWQKKFLAPDFSTIERIVKIGIPQAIEIAGMWMIHAFSIRIISGLGDQGALGAHILAVRVESMSFLPGFAIATAAATLCGQYLGAGSREMAIKSVRLCWKSAVILMGSMGIFFALFRHELIAWMAPDSEIHARLAGPLLIICAITQPFLATCIILKTSMRGAGATTIVMRWSFASLLFYRVAALSLLSKFHLASLTLVWIVLGLDLLTQAIVFTKLHFHGKWLGYKV